MDEKANGLTGPVHVETPESWAIRRPGYGTPVTVCGEPVERSRAWYDGFPVYNFTDAMNEVHGRPGEGMLRGKPAPCSLCMGIISEEYG